MTDTPTITNTFYRPCTNCGKTIEVVAGAERSHDCDPHPDMGVAICRAYWEGHDRAKTNLPVPDLPVEDEPGDDNSTWCVHLQGPDDILPAASRHDAVRKAQRINTGTVHRLELLDEEGLYPTVWAVPGRRIDLQGGAQ